MRFSWYFGWNIVIAASILTLLSSGLRMSMGVFFLPIANDLGFSRRVLSGIIAIGIAIPEKSIPIAITPERTLRLKPRSLAIGRKNTPILILSPLESNVKIDAATTIFQPKYHEKRIPIPKDFL